MAKGPWFANRYIRTAHVGGREVVCELEFSNARNAGPGWDWCVWDDDPSEPLAQGRVADLKTAKSRAATALKRLPAIKPGR